MGGEIVLNMLTWVNRIKSTNRVPNPNQTSCWCVSVCEWVNERQICKALYKCSPFRTVPLSISIIIWSAGLLRVFAMKHGVVGIRGVKSGFYLCMTQEGITHGTVSRTVYYLWPFYNHSIIIFWFHYIFFLPTPTLLEGDITSCCCLDWRIK